MLTEFRSSIFRMRRFLDKTSLENRTSGRSRLTKQSLDLIVFLGKVVGPTTSGSGLRSAYNRPDERGTIRNV